MTRKDLLLAVLITFIWGINFSVIKTLFGSWVWISLLKKYPISTVASVSLLVPVFGFIGSIILFKEPITLMKLVSTALILLGLVLFIFSHRLKGLKA